MGRAQLMRIVECAGQAEPETIIAFGIAAMIVGLATLGVWVLV